MMKRLIHPSQLQDWKARLLSDRPVYEKTVAVSSGTCGEASGSLQIFDVLREELARRNLDGKVGLEITGCHGLCELEPSLIIYPRGIFYKKVETRHISAVVEDTLLKNKIISSLVYADQKSGRKFTLQKEIPFYKKQMRLLTGGNFKINPTRIEDYILADGYQALAKVLFDMTAEEVIHEITASGLREREGEGLLTGKKWQACRDEISEQKYIICHGDGRDPGAYMDRILLEGNPHSVIEGMIIGAYAIGAGQAYICVRREYPLVVRHIMLALEQAQRCGLLGKSILGSEFHLDIHLVLRAAAFISEVGASANEPGDGRSAFSRPQPAFPAAEELWAKRCNITNVETWANVPLIINRGAEWYSKIGTAKSKGTKMFSLAGKINTAGLVEVPMGTKLREIIYGIGRGIKDGKKFKAIQTGGPAGGFLPAQMLGLPVDYNALAKAGTIMGSGEMIVMDETTCLVDMTRYFLGFSQKESPQRCAVCRDRSKQMHDILTRVTLGRGEEKDLVELEAMANSMRTACFCGLGRTAANPVLTGIKYFRQEYEAHILDKSCPAYVCKNLWIHYIEPEKCSGCLLCLDNCPAGAIRGERKKAHVIDQEKCIKCGACYDICPPKIDAISKYTGTRKDKVLKKEISARV